MAGFGKKRTSILRMGTNKSYSSVRMRPRSFSAIAAVRDLRRSRRLPRTADLVRWRSCGLRSSRSRCPDVQRSGRTRPGPFRKNCVHRPECRWSRSKTRQRRRSALAPLASQLHPLGWGVTRSPMTRVDPREISRHLFQYLVHHLANRTNCVSRLAAPPRCS